MIKNILNNLCLKVKEIPFVIYALLPFLVMIAVPLPELILNIFFALNIIYALILLVIVLCSNNIKYYPIFPLLLLFATIFNFALNIKTTHIILTKGLEYNEWLIKKIFSLIDGSENEKIFIGIGILSLIILLNLIVISMSSTGISKATMRFKQEETVIKNEKTKRESIFWNNLDYANKYILGNEKIRIFIILISFFGVILINLLQNNGSIDNIIKAYSPLIFVNVVICILPSLITCLAMGFVTLKFK